MGSSIKRRINISISPELHDAGRSLAKDDSRNFSSMVEWLIRQEGQRRKHAQAEKRRRCR